MVLQRGYPCNAIAKLTRHATVQTNRADTESIGPERLMPGLERRVARIAFGKVFFWVANPRRKWQRALVEFVVVELADVVNESELEKVSTR